MNYPKRPISSWNPCRLGAHYRRVEEKDPYRLYELVVKV